MGALDGCAAIVTGASRGVGKGCALELGAAGATVYATGRTLKEGDAPLPGSLEATVRDIEALGGRCVGVACDHRDDAQVAALFERVAAESGRLDVDEYGFTDVDGRLPKGPLSPDDRAGAAGRNLT